MIETLAGRRCVSLRRFRHCFRGRPPSETGPVEFTWDDGTFLTLDVNTDWTLDLSNQPWNDPYAEGPEVERRALESEIGVWRQMSAPPSMHLLVGQVVISVNPEFNEVGEVAGAMLCFEDKIMVARVLEGGLSVEVHDR